ncbi:MAG: choice-of-anchor J domain-containing protein [Bacteroidales bacterium]
MYKKFTLFFILLFSLNLISTAQDNSDILLPKGNNRGEFKILQDFEAWPPEGWTFYSLADDCGYESTDEKPASGKACAFHTSKKVDNGIEDWMVSPEIEVPAFGKISFKQKNAYMFDYEFHGIYISTEGSNPEEADFKLLTELEEKLYSWKEEIIDLSEYGGKKVHIGFKYTGKFASKWYIDDFGLISPYNMDLAVTAIHRNSFAIEGKEAKFDVVISNVGQQKVEDQDFNIVDGDFTLTKTVTLEAQESKTIEFSYSPALGKHDLKVSVSHKDDIDKTNDSSTYSFSSLHFEEPVYAYSMMGNEHKGYVARAIVMFEKSDPEKIQAEFSTDQDDAYAMMYLDGFLYYMTVEGKNPKEFIKYNIATGEHTVISKPEVRIINMAYNPEDKLTYGYATNMEDDETPTDFYIINLKTGQMKKMGSVKDVPKIMTFAISNNNIAYATTKGVADLYTITLDEFRYRRVGSTEVSTAYAQGAAWDFSKNELYWAPTYHSETKVLPVGLYKIDVNTAKATLVKDFISEESIVGLSFPYKPVSSVWVEEVSSAIASDELYVYPNPTSSNLVIDGVENSRIQLLDLHGKLIKEYNSKDITLNIDLSFLNNGVYFVKSIKEGGVSCTKVILSK